MADLPLSGLKVLDLTSGPAGGLATMILADFGASVSRVVDEQYDSLNQVPSARMWLRGKSTVSSLQDAVNTADVLVITRPNSHLCDYDSCAAVNPTLVYCEITGMGPDSTLPPYEGVIAAKTGRMKQMQAILPGGGPCFSAVPVATHATAMNVVSGILAAIHKRRHHGIGEKLSTSLVQGLMPYDMGMSIGLQRRALNPRPGSNNTPMFYMPTLNYHPVQCADGKWLQLGNLLPHLFVNFMRVVGLEDLLADLPDKTEEVRDRILTTMQTKTRDDWMALFVADGGVAAHPYLEPEETLNDPDMTENGHVIEMDGTRQLGPMANLTVTPATVTQHAKSGSGWPVEPGPSTREAPLKDITVVELATIIASPLGASFLADMGARVIKVEAIGGDPFRSMPTQGSMRCNQGKQSISIDLKTSRGQEIARKLIAKADVLIHNYRPGVPERLGIGYDQVKADNPGLVYISANGYGPAGPGARRPSTHPIPGAAMGGAGYQAGGIPADMLDNQGLRDASRRIMTANEVNPDPNTAVVVCASAMLGLTAREHTGKGQQIFIDMFGANAYANFDSMVNYDGKQKRPGLGSDLKGPEPIYRLYGTSDGWVFLGILRQQEWLYFCNATGHDTDRSNPSKLTTSLGDLFKTRTSEQWEVLFHNTEVACVVADACTSGEFFFNECHEDSPWMMQVPHPTMPNYYRHRSMVSFAGSDLPKGAPEEAGAHTDELMQELGYSPETVADCFSQGVLWRE
jgi:crotonobetainyl-CoA:carnitine CoA-transferase CaiB-like acyl-CoA transferase